MRSELVLRLDYGSIVPWVRRVDDTLMAVGGPDGLCLRTPVETRGQDLYAIEPASDVAKSAVQPLPDDSSGSRRSVTR